MAEIEATDIFNGVTAMGLQEIEHLLTKSPVTDHQTPHILIPLMVDDKKKTIFRANVGLNDFSKNSDFSAHVFSGVAARPQPYRRPGANTSTEHQGMLSKFHRVNPIRI
jgi:hypothetical protein